MGFDVNAREEVFGVVYLFIYFILFIYLSFRKPVSHTSSIDIVSENYSHYLGLTKIKR